MLISYLSQDMEITLLFFTAFGKTFCIHSIRASFSPLNSDALFSPMYSSFNIAVLETSCLATFAKDSWLPVDSRLTWFSQPLPHRSFSRFPHPGSNHSNPFRLWYDFQVSIYIHKTHILTTGHFLPQFSSKIHDFSRIASFTATIINFSTFNTCTFSNPACINLIIKVLLPPWLHISVPLTFSQIHLPHHPRTASPMASSTTAMLSQNTAFCIFTIIITAMPSSNFNPEN